MEQALLERNPLTPVGLLNLCIHGHFYQPLRVDPFTGIIADEEGSAPYPNYNEKITAECYGPNAELGNFELMSYDMGPTLTSWLERAHPDVYEAIIAASHRHMQRYGVSNALAQVYHHTILPLMSTRDKRTQILWGLCDYRHRYGYDAHGMWLAETAVDMESLDLLAQHGVLYTILAPWQAAHDIDRTEPYLVRLPGGRSMTVFFYKDPASGEVSFHDEVTQDANQFAHLELHKHKHPDKCTKAESQLILLATDGELYGHHKRGREQFVAHLLQKSAPAYGFSVCSLERYLQAHPATKEVRLRAPSAWSCFHGVDRWKTDCPCTDGDGSWKYFLRQALCNLQEVADRLFTDDGSRVLHDPWVARDSYLALRNRWIEPSHFWKHHAASHHRDVSSIYMAQSLLESQYWLQAAFTSCGFFFEDLDRIEPRNTIAFARRAISFVWQATGHDLQCDFLADLELVRSWRTGRTGTDLYRSLPAVPESLLPTEKQSVR